MDIFLLQKTKVMAAIYKGSFDQLVSRQQRLGSLFIHQSSNKG